MKKVVVVSDIHCGSVFGLLPEGFVNSEDKVVEQNVGQQHLWQCWLDFCNVQVKPFNPDVVIFNGDAVDGAQRKNHGVELSLPLILDQEEAAVETLRVLRNAAPNAEWFFVQGTEYHEDGAARSLENIASRLEARKYVGLGTGRYSKEVLDLELEGVVINAAHHISGSGGIYRATAADREGIWSALAGKEGKSPKADVVVRSHVHSFIHVEHESKHIVVSPCWQLQTRYARHKSAYQLLPSIGGVLLTIDGKKKERGLDPCQVEKRIYPLPPIKTVKL